MKRGVQKRHLAALLLAELVLLAFLFAGAQSGSLYRERFGEEGGRAVPDAENAIPLARGSYEVTVEYRTDREGFVCTPMAESATGRELPAGQSLLPAYQTQRCFQMRLSETTQRFFIQFASLAGEQTTDLQITGVTIRETRQAAYARCIAAALCIALLDLLLFYRLRAGKPLDAKRRSLLFALTAVWFVASLPLFQRSLIGGHDLNFHLMRIEGLARGLAAGQFPVRIQSGWLNDFGYAVSILYGDLLLYVPAAFRAGGFSLQEAYKLYVLGINAVTVATSYACARRAGGSARLGLAGCMLYTLSYYRLYDLYTRAAVGEFTAMAFLPLIFEGLYLLLHTEEKRRAQLCLLAGCTFLLQSHLLSFGIALLFSGFYCLLHVRAFWKKLPAVLLLAGETVLLNLGFLIPFDDYMSRGDLWISNGVPENMQAHGYAFLQLFQLYGDVWQGLSRPGPGLVLTLVAVLFLWECVVCRKPIRSAAGTREWGRQCRMFALLLLALWMASEAFPWNAVGELPLVGGALTSFQFAWRFLSAAAAAGMLVGVYAMKNMQAFCSKRQAEGAVVLVCALIFAQGMLFLNEQSAQAGTGYVADTSGIDSITAISGGEYLVQGMDPGHATETEVAAGEGVEISRITRRENRFVISCENTSEQEQWITVPVFSYHGYQARDLATGQPFLVTGDPYGALRVSLPAGYRGELGIWFQDRRRWTLGLLVSLLTLAGLAWRYGIRGKSVVDKCASSIKINP